MSPSAKPNKKSAPPVAGPNTAGAAVQVWANENKNGLLQQTAPGYVGKHASMIQLSVKPEGATNTSLPPELSGALNALAGVLIGIPVPQMLLDNGTIVILNQSTDWILAAYKDTAGGFIQVTKFEHKKRYVFMYSTVTAINVVKSTAGFRGNFLSGMMSGNTAEKQAGVTRNQPHIGDLFV